MRYLDIIHIINENRQQYIQMLQPLVDLELFTPDQAQQVATEARQKLKRNDRIVWYLKWARALVAYKKAKAWNIPKEKKDQIILNFKKITGIEWLARNEELEIFHNDFVFGSAYIEHVLSQMQQIPNLENMQWLGNPSAVKLQIDEIEQAHAQKANRSLTPKYEDQVLISYNNSAWFLLPRGACNDEAEAMGHCGNVPSEKPGDRILSYREKTKDGKWKPQLTFILDRFGMLGEMKGFANAKPTAEYHSVIVDLLKHDLVKGIVGGGFAANKNFIITDLPPATQEKLLQSKPGLGGWNKLIEQQGLTDLAKLWIESLLENSDAKIVWNDQEQIVQLKYYQTFDEMANANKLWGIVDFVDKLKMIGDGDLVDIEDWYDQTDLDSDQVEEFAMELADSIADALDTETLEKIFDRYNIDRLDSKSIKNTPQLFAALIESAETIILNRYEKLIIRSVEQWVKDNPYIVPDHTNLTKEKNGFRLIMPYDELLAARSYLSKIDRPEELITVNDIDVRDMWYSPSPQRIAKLFKESLENQNALY